MDTEKDLELEIMELSSIPPPQSSTMETQFATDINVPNNLRLGLEPSIDSTNCRASTSGATTFKRFSSIDEMDIVYYENVLTSTIPIRDRIASTDQILPSNTNAPIESSSCLLQDDVLSLRTRLRIRKQRLKFIEFSVYAMKDVFREVESIICLDIVFLAFSLLMSALGCIRVDSCKASVNIPVMMVVCGLLDSAANFCGIIASFQGKTHRYYHRVLRDFCRIDRSVMFFMHAYSLILILLIIPPEERDHDSPYYCDGLVFWTAFCYFHITLASSIFIWIGMAVAAASYFI